MGFLNLLKKALPHFADAEKIVTAARRDGASGAAMEVVKAVLVSDMASPMRGALLSLAASADDHQQDLEKLEARIINIEKEVTALKGKIK